MKPTVLTCGVYGFDGKSFKKAVQKAKPDVFVDVRRRRGVRGHDYAFANSQRLQDMLQELSIPYVHRLDLAPPQSLVKHEGEVDKKHHIARHDREELSPEFVRKYSSDVLKDLDVSKLIDELGDNVKRPLFFCVERTAAACHRGLLAEHIANELGWSRKDLEP